MVEDEGWGYKIMLIEGGWSWGDGRYEIVLTGIEELEIREEGQEVRKYW